MSGSIVPIAWRAREQPLPPSAAVAIGPDASRLAERLSTRDDAALARLVGVWSREKSGAIVVIGEAADLPWIDGVRYLGRDPRAPALLVPTTLEPDVPIELVARAIVRRAGDRAGSGLAVLPDIPLVVPCGGALPIARARLLARLGQVP
jgi:hypothetical protein